MVISKNRQNLNNNKSKLHLEMKNLFDKSYKISVLGLLILILAVSITNLRTHPFNTFNEDYVIELSKGELGNLATEVFTHKRLHYSEDLYTFEEFGKLIDYKINNSKDIYNYAIKNEYSVLENEHFTQIDLGEKCVFDSIRNKEICMFQNIEFNKIEKNLILKSSTDPIEVLTQITDISIPNFTTSEDIMNMNLN